MCYLEVMDYERQFLVQNDSVDPEISGYGDEKHGLRPQRPEARTYLSPSRPGGYVCLVINIVFSKNQDLSGKNIIQQRTLKSQTIGALSGYHAKSV